MTKILTLNFNFKWIKEIWIWTYKKLLNYDINQYKSVQDVNIYKTSFENWLWDQNKCKN